jgi:aryl-alcohol dehydrogenase-like predicted oxidoreductase
MTLGLGTVQFGLDYGISNPGGKTPLPEVARILDSAARQRISVLDTAPGYGNSEEALGGLEAARRFRLVTKTPMLNKRSISAADGLTVAATLATSLARLKADAVYGCIVHQADDLLAEGGDYIYEALVAAREHGQVQKIGASVYDARQIDGLLTRYALDIVQLPLNVLDQRLLRTGHFRELKARGVEIHVRSVFLQGLLLMSLDNLPPYFAPLHPHLERYHDWLRRERLTPLQAALQFIRSVANDDTLICGINTCEQLEEICSALSQHAVPADWHAFAVDDPAMVNPSLWKL